MTFMATLLFVFLSGTMTGFAISSLLWYIGVYKKVKAYHLYTEFVKGH